MKMKSLKTQFIGAIAMVLVAAVAMGSSTYAWFAMNLSVTATGMQVQVKSDSTFLLIQDSADTEVAAAVGDAAKALAVQADELTTVPLTVDNANAAVYPSMPWATATASQYDGVTTAYAVTTYATAAVPGNWITANSQDPNYSTTKTAAGDMIANEKALTAFTGYVIKKSVTMTLSVGSETANNLQVTGYIAPKDIAEATGTVAAGKTYYTLENGAYKKIASPGAVGDAVPANSYVSSIDITAVKVLVVTDDDNITTLNYGVNGVAQSLYATSNVDLTPTTAIIADIYIYYDGSETAVFSNNKANLGGADIQLAFSVAVKSA